ncbi:MAG TPA: hypothetical protein VNY31_11305 [Solirubrobacteraceae bacterium]|nr:hypothetical protein [Solirubrobacteraceae bacterium]
MGHRLEHSFKQLFSRAEPAVQRGLIDPGSGLICASFVPFHRYIAVWLRNEKDYLAHEPALSTIRGRPITSDEYVRMRELSEHRH